MMSLMRFSGSGGTFNTFGGKVEAFSPARQPPPPHKSEGKNFLTNPSKKGTFGMTGLTLAPYPPYAPESFDAALEEERKRTAADKAKNKGGAFKVHTAILSQTFDVNPFAPPEKGKHIKNRVIKAFNCVLQPRRPAKRSQRARRKRYYLFTQPSEPSPWRAPATSLAPSTNTQHMPMSRLLKRYNANHVDTNHVKVVVA